MNASAVAVVAGATTNRVPNTSIEPEWFRSCI